MNPLNPQNDPGDQKNLLMAVVLSVCALIGWQVLYANPQIEKERKRLAAIEATKKTDASKSVPTHAGGSPPAAGEHVTAGGAAPVPGHAQGAGEAPGTLGLDRAAALARSKRLAIKTPALLGSINLDNGRIDDITLVKYHTTIDPKSPNIVVYSPANSQQPYFAEYGWVEGPNNEVKLPGPDVPWTVQSKGDLTPSNPIKLVRSNGAGLTFQRVISVDDNYMFQIKDTVDNKTDKPVSIIPYGRIFQGFTPNIQGFWVQHEGLIGFLGDEKLQKLSYKEALEPGGNLSFKGIEGGWLGFTDKYWASALIPDQKAKFVAQLTGKPASGKTRDHYQADYLLDTITVKPGASHSVDQRLFVGAKKVSLIQQYENDKAVFEFSYIIDWGWFFFITKPLYELLHWLYGLVGNFGVAILMVTVIVKAAFFWFANKSYASMAKMKKLQPEMVRIRERYKDDKAQQQKELMELYKKEKINPLAGCLPVIIQIPVFFALYKVLFISIDMRHAPFFGWIHDLSAPDPTSLFNLFGLLPYSVPAYLTIGAWPLIMGITMWIQMQLNPKQPDPVQQQVFNWMPVMFTFLLASFPAGLVIYWAWNNTLSLIQQYFIMKRQGVDVPLFDNLKGNFAAVGNLLGRRRGNSKS